MLPEKYVKEVRRHEKNRYVLKHLVISGLILGCMYVFGPLIHEMSHVLWLEQQNCYYTTEFGFSLLSGLTGSVKPFCHMSRSSLFIFYGAGYMSTLFTGTVFLVTGDLRQKYEDYLLSAGIGMMLSVLLTVNTRGDLVQIAELLRISSGNYILVSGFITLGLLGTSLKAAELLVEDLEREESSAD